MKMQVAATLPVLMRPDVVKSVYMVLKLLGTGWGTCALACTGGVNTITRKHPRLRKFSKLTPREQEKVLQGWSRSPIPQIRQMFKAFKSIVGWAFYSNVRSHHTFFEHLEVILSPKSNEHLNHFRKPPHGATNHLMTVLCTLN